MPESSFVSPSDPACEPDCWLRCSFFSDVDDIAPCRACSNSCKLGVFSLSASRPSAFSSLLSASRETSGSAWLCCSSSRPSLSSGKYTNFLLPGVLLCEAIAVVLFVQERRLRVAQAFEYDLCHRSGKLAVQVWTQRNIVGIDTELFRPLN